MRLFRNSGARWPISVLCMIVMLNPIIGIALLPQPVAAQMGTIEVAVVDFRNLSRIPNDMFGTMATDAVVVELLRSGKFGVTTADVLQSTMEELGYKSKGERAAKMIMTPSMMVRLGQEVGADGIISGEITSINLDADKRRAEIKLTVRMLHVASGEWENGAIAVGVSNPRIGFVTDKETDLIIEAINNAARECVESMVRYIIPEAAVIGTFGTNEVLLSRGAQEGLQVGMDMIALRRSDSGDDDVVGRIRITRVSDTDARAVVTKSARGLKPEDRVRAVYTIPTEAGTHPETTRFESRQRVERGTKVLMGLVALVGLATLFKGGSGRQEVPGAVAMAGVSPEITNRWGQSGGIMLGWNGLKGVKHSDILEYHVFMDNFINYSMQDAGDLANVGPQLTVDRITALQITTPMGTYAHHTVIDEGVWSPLSYRYADSNHDLQSASIDPQIGITMGRTHRFWINALYARRTTNLSGEQVVTYWHTDGVYAGTATYLIRPEPRSPGGIVPTDIVNMQNVIFEWVGSRGADEYVLELSPDPSFPRDKTWVKRHYQPTPADQQVIRLTLKDELQRIEAGQIKVVPELASVPPGGIVHWRVGSRNRLDNPGPYPAGPSPAADGPKSTRFIYSEQQEVFRFTTLPEMPGIPPGSDPGGPSDPVGPQPPPPPPI